MDSQHLDATEARCAYQALCNGSEEIGDVQVSGTVGAATDKFLIPRGNYFRRSLLNCMSMNVVSCSIDLRGDYNRK